MLTMLARERAEVACTEVLSDQEWQTIYIMSKSKAPPHKPPSLKEATRMLASLGGFLGRKGDGEPGTKPSGSATPICSPTSLPSVE
jgi:hypothetical protein